MGGVREQRQSRDVRPATVVLRGCRLTVTKGPQPGREFFIAGDIVRAGKAEDNDVVLDEPTVSRVHFEIVSRPRGYLVRDLRSTNGTFLDGARIHEAYLHPGAIVGAGAVQLRFQPVEERTEVQPSERCALGGMIGGTPVMRLVFGIVERVAPTDMTVLVEGEPGCGKSLLARTLHELSRRRSGPSIVVPCRQLGGEALEAELIGHERVGHSTGGGARQGAFERATGGTLILDDVDELSHDMQTKVLRVIEQGELRRVGGNKTIQVDARLVAISRRDLQVEVEKGRFRDDLHAHLAAVTVAIPPLRERLDDVPLLLARCQTVGNERIDAEILATLQRHDWPGNVAELHEFVAGAMGYGRLRPAGACGSDGALLAVGQDEGIDFDPSLPFRDQKDRWTDEFERRYLVWLLARAAGNISKAARDADMDRKYLHKLLKKHGIATPGGD